MLPLRQQAGCFRGWSGQWTHLGIEKEAGGWGAGHGEISANPQGDTRIQALLFLQTHSLFCLMTIRSLSPSWGVLFWEEGLPFEARPSGHYLGLLGLGLALEAGTGLSAPWTQFDEGLEGVVTKAYELLLLDLDLGRHVRASAFQTLPR